MSRFKTLRCKNIRHCERMLFLIGGLAAGPDDWRYNYDKIPIERMLLEEPAFRTAVLRLPAVYGRVTINFAFGSICAKWMRNESCCCASPHIRPTKSSAGSRGHSSIWLQGDYAAAGLQVAYAREENGAILVNCETGRHE